MVVDDKFDLSEISETTITDISHVKGWKFNWGEIVENHDLIIMITKTGKKKRAQPCFHNHLRILKNHLRIVQKGYE